MQFPKTPQGWLTLALSILALLGVTISITSDGGATTVSVTVNTPEGTTQVTAPAAAVEAVENSPLSEHAGSMPKLCPFDEPAPTVTPSVVHDRIPACVTPSEFNDGAEQTAEMITEDRLPDPPLAAPKIPGCSTKMIKHNFSSRGGVRPVLIVLHQTISPDNGWAGVNAIVNYFGRPGPRVSSHFVVAGAKDACAYIVHTGNNAWTQVEFNSRSISIEVTGTQSQGYYVKGPGRARLVKLLAEISHDWGIPLRRASVAGCTVRRSGVIDHVGLGACGGNHSDIKPYRATIDGVIRDAARVNSTVSRRINYPTRSHFGPQRRKWCKQLAILRKNAAADRARGKQTWPLSRRVAANRYNQRIGAGEQRCRFV